MKITVLIGRFLLGLMFFVFGLNGLVPFLPAQPMGGTADVFLGALVSSHYTYFISGVQLITGILLLANRFVPLALALLAPVIANILVFHLTMQPAGLPPGVLALMLWSILAWQNRRYFVPLFTQKADPNV